MIDGAKGAANAADFGELSRMASWRIEHMKWREKTEQEISALTATTSGKTAAAQPIPKPTAAPAFPSPTASATP